MGQREIVVVAEKRELDSNINMYSNELDFSSREITEYILASLEKLSYKTAYYETPKQFLEHISRHRNSVVFTNQWGGYHSRNKRSLLPAICEAYQLKYIGADAYVQALCQDKYLTKSYLKDYLFSIPKAIQVSCVKEIDRWEKIGFYPCIIKPNDEGCSVGISTSSIVTNFQSAKQAGTELLKHYQPILAEEFIQGREISICCAGTAKQVDIAEAVELYINGMPLDKNIWSYETKIVDSASVSKKAVTGEIPGWIIHEGKRLFSSLGKVDFMRIDGRLYQDKFYVIELSPDCSLHPSCFMATAFYHAGYSYAQMLERLISYEC